MSLSSIHMGCSFYRRTGLANARPVLFMELRAPNFSILISFRTNHFGSSYLLRGGRKLKMYCPNCSEPKVDERTQFCKRCGLDLFGLSEFVESGEGGTPRPHLKNKRQKGIKQGAMLVGLGLLLIPVWLFVAMIFPPNDRLVESAPSTTLAEGAAWIAMWMAFIAGALRIAYALIFEKGSSEHGQTQWRNKKATTGYRGPEALPSADAFRPAEPGRWKTTGDLYEHAARSKKSSGELS